MIDNEGAHLCHLVNASGLDKIADLTVIESEGKLRLTNRTKPDRVLEVLLWGHLPVIWNGSYLVDFLGMRGSIAEEALAFLTKFLNEEECSGVAWLGQDAYQGGPCDCVDTPDWSGDLDRIVIESWDGTYDRTIRLSR